MTGAAADTASAEKGASSAVAGMAQAGPLVVPGSKPPVLAVPLPEPPPSPEHAASASAQVSAATATPLFREKRTAASRFGQRCVARRQKPKLVNSRAVRPAPIRVKTHRS